MINYIQADYDGEWLIYANYANDEQGLPSRIK